MSGMLKGENFDNVGVGEIPIKTSSGWDGTTPSGTGDMVKSVYDTDNDGVVDNSEKLGGQSPSYYATDADVVHLTGNEIISGIKTVPALQFDTTSSLSCAQGQVSWDVDTGTLKVGMIDSNVCLNIGQEQFIYAKNTSGAIITNGTPVYISGASGANIEIAKADASSQDNCRKTIAVATEDIGINAFGYVTTFGFVRDVNTNGFVEGGEIFIKVGGGYTQTQPALPNAVVKIGTCARANTNNGVIFVNIIPVSRNEVLADTGDLTIRTEANKTVFFEQPCYRDEFPTTLVPAGGASAPDQVAYTIGGIAVTRYSFDGVNTEERISGSFEIPHDYKTDAPIEVHIHWLPSTTGSGNVQWHFDWCFLKVDSAPQAETTLSIVDTVSSNQQYFHKIKAFGNLPTNGYDLGDKILFNLRRTPSGTNDTYAGDAILEQIALHVPVDTLGSRQIYIK